MSSRLTRTDVERVAALAHLELTDDEVELFTGQLADILEYADRLQAVDTASVSATWHPMPFSSPLREDVVRDSLSPVEALANAPDPAPGPLALFRVPKVIG
jgi:aspartyl-tRNA(Asn)/glutamyl-tRNA(Gln) amidotransferase subunit C